MRRTWKTACVLLGVATLAPLSAQAADHTDGPQASADPSADITDVFSWMSTDGSKLYLVMDITKNATSASKFSTAVKYVFHLTSYPGLLMGAADRRNVICTFDAMQKASCWLTDAKNANAVLDYLPPTDVSVTTGSMSTGGKMKVFAGLRDDPFFFNLTGLKNVEQYVHDNAAALVGQADPDGATGCHPLTDAQKTTAVNALKSPDNHDDFAKLNVLSLVIALDKTTVTSTGNTLVGVWGSTNK